MSRRRRHISRKTVADPVFESMLVGRMIGYILKQGSYLRRAGWFTMRSSEPMKVDRVEILSQLFKKLLKM
jgi:hypothetical protein